MTWTQRAIARRAAAAQCLQANLPLWADTVWIRPGFNLQDAPIIHQHYSDLRQVSTITTIAHPPRASLSAVNTRSLHNLYQDHWQTQDLKIRLFGKARRKARSTAWTIMAGASFCAAVLSELTELQATNLLPCEPHDGVRVWPGSRRPLNEPLHFRSNISILVAVAAVPPFSAAAAAVAVVSRYCCHSPHKNTDGGR